MEENKSLSKCAVIGYGSWATTLVGCLTSAGHAVNWLITNPEVAAGVLEVNRNPKYVSDLQLDLSLITVSDDINDVVADCELVLLACPSAFLKKNLEPLTEPLEDKFIISAIKGIVPDELVTVLEYMHNVYGLPFRRMGVISGPSHAEEVSRGRLSYLTAAAADDEAGERIASLFRGPSLRVDTSKDIYGIEYAAVLKNIYAIASGLATGLGYGDNFLAVLIAGCAAEMKRFLDYTYPAKDERNVMDRAYLGDLLVTCYSSYSRNRRLGQLIGRGCTVKSAINEMTMIAEGYYGADCIDKSERRAGLSLPIADMVYDVLYRKASPRRAMASLAATL